MALELEEISVNRDRRRGHGSGVRGRQGEGMHPTSLQLKATLFTNSEVVLIYA